MKAVFFINQRVGSDYSMTKRHMREEIILSYTTGNTSKLFQDVTEFFLQEIYEWTETHINICTTCKTVHCLYPYSNFAGRVMGG
jgi:hypothetical protein